jgi:hypothetical protein
LQKKSLPLNPEIEEFSLKSGKGKVEKFLVVNPLSGFKFPGTKIQFFKTEFWSKQNIFSVVLKIRKDLIFFQCKTLW